MKQITSNQTISTKQEDQGQSLDDGGCDQRKGRDGIKNSFSSNGCPGQPIGEEKVVTLKERQYVEILIVSTVQREPFEQLKDASEILDVKKEQSKNLILRLIKELIQKQQGLIEFEVDENKTRTLMSVRFPVERRQVILYEQVNL